MITVSNVNVLENPCKFLKPFQFKIAFLTDENIEFDELNWRVIYVGSAESKDFDQIILSQTFGPFRKGQHEITLCSKSVDPTKIPEEEIVGSTIVLVVGFYRQKQFFQIGYIVTNEYEDVAEHQATSDYDRIRRIVHEDCCRAIVEDDDVPDFSSVSDLSNVDIDVNGISLDDLTKIFRST